MKDVFLKKKKKTLSSQCMTCEGLSW